MKDNEKGVANTHTHIQMRSQKQEREREKEREESFQSIFFTRLLEEKMLRKLFVCGSMNVVEDEELKERIRIQRIRIKEEE